MCDGLELWLVLVITGQALNVVQQDSLWCSAYSGVDFSQYPILLLTTYGQAVWCALVAESAEEESAISSVPDVVQDTLKKHGRAMTERLSPGSTTPSSHASSTETDTELLMEGPEQAVICPPGVGTAKERICPVCDSVFFSGLALIQHLRSEHPDSYSYDCVQCGSVFNTKKDLSSHVSLMHRDPQVKCQFCTYLTTSWARMRHYVRVHTKGEHCALCRKTFPSVRALERHSVLHGHRQKFECDLCDATFSTTSSLVIHICGKYGDGYVCENCQRCFDSPAQRKWHSSKCGKWFMSMTCIDNNNNYSIAYGLLRKLHAHLVAVELTCSQ